MVDPNIQLPSLPATASVALSDLLHVRQGTIDKKATIAVLKTLLLNGRDYTAEEILSLLNTVGGEDSDLDADTVDGVHAESFVRSDQADTITGTITFGAIPAFNGGTSGVSSPFSVGSTQVVVNLNADLLDGQQGSFYRNASNLNAGTVPQSRLSASTLLTLIKTVHGAGSGLDADLLDGQQGSYYRNANNLNAGTVPSARISGQYGNAQVSASNLYTGTVPSARLPLASEGARGALEVATEAETNAGTSNQRIITPQKLRLGFSVSLSTNGHISFPSWLGGVTINWGKNTVNSNSTSNINLSQAYSVSHYIAVGSASTAVSVESRVGANSLSLSQVQLINSANGSNQQIHWISIGR
jgi:hypothetical protein